jgi:hypothetical protein
MAIHQANDTCGGSRQPEYCRNPGDFTGRIQAYQHLQFTDAEPAAMYLPRRIGFHYQPCCDISINLGLQGVNVYGLISILMWHISAAQAYRDLIAQRPESSTQSVVQFSIINVSPYLAHFSAIPDSIQK